MLNISPPAEYVPTEKPIMQWLDEISNYMLAAVGSIDEDRKRAILLSTIGPNAKKVIANFPAQKKDTYNHLTEALTEHYAETRSVRIQYNVPRVR